MMYLVNEFVLRLIKPAIALVLGLTLYLIITAVFGEQGSALLALACWISATTFILLFQEGVI
jgi:hypothetical protein